MPPHFGGNLKTFLGWSRLFLTVSAAVLVVALGARLLPATARPATVPPLRAVAARYVGLLPTPRARHICSYVLVNAVLHAGIFTWLGLYLTQRFELGEWAIGRTLLGYGIPGFLLGPAIGHLADRYGRARITQTVPTPGVNGVSARRQPATNVAPYLTWKGSLTAQLSR
jgi:predicted MFS family arabinose efflux permease